MAQKIFPLFWICLAFDKLGRLNDLGTNLKVVNSNVKNKESQIPKGQNILKGILYQIL